MAHEPDELEVVRSQLIQHFEVVDRKGDGPTGFVYSEFSDRAIEISLHQGNWWVEFWERGGDGYESPCKDLTVAHVDDAIRHIVSWLKRHE